MCAMLQALLALNRPTHISSGRNKAPTEYANQSQEFPYLAVWENISRAIQKLDPFLLRSMLLQGSIDNLNACCIATGPLIGPEPITVAPRQDRQGNDLALWVVIL